MRNNYTSVLSKILTSREVSKQDRRTPKAIFDHFDEIYNFQLDPCTSTSKPNNLGTPHYYHYDPDTKVGDNGLTLSWSKYKSVFANPPWANLETWIKKAYYESLDSCTVAVLLPVKSDTNWFHEYVLEKSDIIHFIKGRVIFEGHDNPFILGIAIAIFNPEKEDRTNLRELEVFF
jgi:phage N-6-adenine-methyltransferase